MPIKLPEVGVFEKDTECFELRKRGFTYRQIGAALNVSTARAYNGVKRTLHRAAATQAEENVDVLRMEVERLDSMMQNIFPYTMPHMIETDDGKEVKVPPSFEAVDRVLKIMDRRAKLLGLDQMVLTVQAGNRGGATIPTPATGTSGEITPQDEAKMLLTEMSKAGILDAETTRAIREALGERIIDAQSIEIEPPLEIGSGDLGDDGEPFYDGVDMDDLGGDTSPE